MARSCECRKKFESENLSGVDIRMLIMYFQCLTKGRSERAEILEKSVEHLLKLKSGNDFQKTSK